MDNLEIAGNTIRGESDVQLKAIGSKNQSELRHSSSTVNVEDVTTYINLPTQKEKKPQAREDHYPGASPRLSPFIVSVPTRRRLRRLRRLLLARFVLRAISSILHPCTGYKRPPGGQNQGFES